ncbi:putative cyclin-D7-1 [Quercus lobata]|uniref:B-like cyclin n=1 Tax=Quercus lobata TaxID=97700 RepID=A0A7N2M6S9_QUELO|nr:putative cyclin-D7-1 [Quercus lobata]
MESLLCDESWLSSPATPIHQHATKHHSSESCYGSFYTTKEDCEQALAIYLEKEMSYMPEASYIEHLRSKNLIFARFRAIQWLFRSRSRLNLSFETAFHAASYLDRFISMHQCNGWEHWMVELLSVACLSIASKFSETCTPSLHEIQMENLDHSFHPSTIQQMELKLSEALGWRLGSTTAYSYVELLMWSTDSLKPHLHEEFITRVTELLLGAISDSKVLEFRPSVIAVSALWCSLDELHPSTFDAYLTSLTRHFNQSQKDDLVRCHMIMEAQQVGSLQNLIDNDNGNYYDCPSSPTTVLPKQPIDICDCSFNFSFLKMRGPNVNLNSSRKKRKREED